MDRGWIASCVLAACLAGLGGFCPTPALADDWPPVNPADLSAKDSPDRPGAHAIYLYRQDDRDDISGHDDIYERIKIFTEEGKKYGDVELPYFSAVYTISNVRARTIRPDGSAVEWTGKPLDKTILKLHGFKEQAKTFTLPDVQAGCIIEYKYRMSVNSGYLYDNTWNVQKELFTRQAKFTFHPSSFYDLLWLTFGIPAASPVVRGKDGIIRLDVQNVPGLVKEEYMPPEETVTSRVDFFYTQHGTTDPDKFWKQVGQVWFEGTEKYIGRRKAMTEEVGRTVAANDSPETKLRKLYARVQTIRNTSFDRQKTEQEAKRENQKENENVEDVLKHGSGDGAEIDLLFCALARAAGMDASIVRVSTRNIHFFSKTILETRQLNDIVVSVKLGDKDVYLDPGNAHAPYGLLPWSETFVEGLKLDKDGGQFVVTAKTTSSDAVTRRVAKLAMGDDGIASGKLTVTFLGQEALSRRLSADDNDEAERKQSLVDEVKGWLSVGATVELTNSPEWKGSDTPLIAEFDIKMRPVGTQTGRRLLISQAIFANPVATQFDHVSRTYPVYFDYPYSAEDDVTLQLPLALRVANVPAAQDRQNGMGFYQISTENQGASLRLTRKMGVAGILYPVEAYGAIRNFFNQVKAGDEQQVILEVPR